MITIGNKKVILSTTLLVPDGESAEFEFTIRPGDHLHLRFEFIEEINKETGDKALIDTNYVDEVFIITFKNFQSPMGNSFGEPMVFATTDKGEKIDLLASIYKYKNLTKAEIQIRMEEIK